MAAGTPSLIKAASTTARAAGVFLLALPLVPLAALYGPVPGGEALVPAADWGLGLAIFGAGAWVAAILLAGRVGDPARLVRPAKALPPALALAIALAVLAAILIIVGRAVFEFRPHHVDSIVQLFQAEIFAAGMVAAPVPPEPAFFDVLHMVVTDGRWYAQYPPAHAALLALGVLVRAPWAVPLILTLGTAALLAGFARRAYDGPTAAVTVVLLLASPFFWIMGASFMNHVSALFFVALFLYAFARWESAGERWAALAGAALGAALLSRPLTAVAVGAPYALFARRRPRGLVLGAGTFLAVAGLYLAFNAATTGHPLRTGYVELWGAEHGLGFHATPWGGRHTLAAGLRNELFDLSLLEALLFEWPIPSLWPMGLLFALGWGVARWDRRLLVGFFAIPLAYLFYWHRDAYLGPRFAYETVAFAAPLTARAIVVGAQRLRGRSLRLGSAGRSVDAAVLGLALVASCVAYAALYSAPRRVAAYAAGWGSMEVDVLGEARAAGIESGVIFVATTWGERLVAEMREAGAPAALVERVYRRSDHCALAEVLSRARDEGWNGARVTAALERLAGGPRAPLVRPPPNGDPSLRLDPERAPAAACIAEIVRDRQGTTIYAPHLLANEPRLGGPFVVARDLGTRNGSLLERFAGRPAFLWRPGRFEPVGGAGP